MKRATLALSCALLSCAPPFTSPAIVAYPRVLAVIADAPTVEPGASVSVTPILGGNSAEGTFRWTFCVRPETASSGLPLSSFGAFEPERGCETTGAQSVADAQDTREATFRIPANLLDDDGALRTAFGPDISIDTARSLARRAGVSVVATLTWVVDGTVTTAFKRVLVKPAERNTNPPPPVVRMKGRELRAPSGRIDERCEFTDGMGPLRVSPSERVFIEPDTSAPWLEDFTYVDASGNDVRVSEQVFRNWFSTVGAWDFGRARAPDTNPTWIAPKAPGSATLWLVIRDGHGGTSACRWSAVVE